MTETSSIAPFPSLRRHSLPVVLFRDELTQILNVYGRMVAAGEWRDYRIDAGSEEAVFSIFRRASEMPVYRIVKRPALAKKQGAYLVLGMDGQVLKRGATLSSVLNIFEKRLLKLVD